MTSSHDSHGAATPIDVEEDASSEAFIKPAFGYFGAKQRLARRIIEMLPPHSAWVEVFCGSAVITLNKMRAPIEVINDLDGDIVNVFQVLRDQPEELIRATSLTPYAREEFQTCRADRSALEPLERARRFLVASMMTVNGTAGSIHSGFSFSDSYVRGAREARVNRWYQLPDRLHAVVERLRSVRIDNLDAREVVRRFARRPATLLYLDPPYLMDRRHTYATDANQTRFHEELLEECVDADCMIIISGYKNALYSRYLNRANGWTSTNLKTNTRGVEGVDKERTELLWVNRHFRSARRSGKIPVTLTKAETKEHKVNPLRSDEYVNPKIKKYPLAR